MIIIQGPSFEAVDVEVSVVSSVEDFQEVRLYIWPTNDQLHSLLMAVRDGGGDFPILAGSIADAHLLQKYTVKFCVEEHDVALIP